MGQGPTLALLLAGPALSLPSMIVIGKIMGAKKTLADVSLVVVTATVSGLVFGTFARQDIKKMIPSAPSIIGRGSHGSCPRQAPRLG